MVFLYLFIISLLEIVRKSKTSIGNILWQQIQISLVYQAGLFVKVINYLNLYNKLI